MPLSRQYTRVTAQPKAAEPSFLQRMGGIRGLLGTGTRIGSGVLASAGGWPGAAIAGAGEGLAEGLEGSEINPARIGVEAGLGAVPFRKVFQLGKMGSSALRSGALSATGTAGRQLSMGEDLDPRAIAESGGLGALLGGFIGKMSAGTQPQAATKATRYEIEPTAQPGGRVLGQDPETRGIPLSRGTGEAIRMQRDINPPVVPPEHLGIAGLGRGEDVDLYPRVQLAGAGIRDLSRGETAAARAAAKAEKGAGNLDQRLNSMVISDQLKEEAQRSRDARALTAMLDEDEASALLERERIQGMTAGLTRGPKRVSSSSSATSEGGEAFRESFPWQRQGGKKKRGATLKPPPITREQQLDGLPGAEEAAPPLTSPTVPQTAYNIDEPLGGLGRFFGVKGEDKFFSEGGVEPVGVGRFYGVQEPMDSPRAPRGLSPAQKAREEAEQLLKAKMAEESNPRPPGWDVYPPEISAILDELGPLQRSLQKGDPRKALLGQEMRDLRLFFAGKNAKGEPLMYDHWRGAKTGAEAPTSTASTAGAGTPIKPPTTPTGAGAPAVASPPAPPSAPTGEGATPPPAGAGGPLDSSNPATPSFLARLKKLYDEQGGGGGERGAINPALLHSITAGAGGAILGSITDPFDDPVTSAGVGLIAGMSSPLIARGLKNIGATPQMIADVKEKVISEGPKRTAQRILFSWPQFQRFNMLMGPNLPANSIVAGWGAAMTGAIEAGLSGDERGWRLAKAMLGKEYFQNIGPAWEEAVDLIRRGDLGRAETVLSDSTLGKTIALPGSIMTTTDVAARNTGKAHGFTEEEMRNMTSTGEPKASIYKRISDFTKGDPVAQSIMPFTRTLANLAEQGMRRAPFGVGMLVQALSEAPSETLRTQIMQQAMSLGIGGSNYFLGQQLDPETAKMVRAYATNLAGRYGMIAAGGFAAGQASRAGGNPSTAAMLRGAQEALPLPTTEIPESWIRFISGNGRIPRGIMPSVVQEEFFPDSQPRRLPGIRRPQ